MHKCVRTDTSVTCAYVSVDMYTHEHMYLYAFARKRKSEGRENSWRQGETLDHSWSMTLLLFFSLVLSPSLFFFLFVFYLSSLSFVSTSLSSPSRIILSTSLVLTIFFVYSIYLYIYKYLYILSHIVLPLNLFFDEDALRFNLSLINFYSCFLFFLFLSYKCKLITITYWTMFNNTVNTHAWERARFLIALHFLSFPLFLTLTRSIFLLLSHTYTCIHILSLSFLSSLTFSLSLFHFMTCTGHTLFSCTISCNYDDDDNHLLFYPFSLLLLLFLSLSLSDPPSLPFSPDVPSIFPYWWFYPSAVCYLSSLFPTIFQCRFRFLLRWRATID